MKTDFDVIVVGGGGSGLAAAVSAAECGCSVLLLEKCPQLGGTTGIAVGSFTANRTVYQQRAGIEGINPYSTGDGHRLAGQAGAQLVNMDVTYGPELRFIPPPRKPFSQLLPGGGPAAWLLGTLLPLVPKAVIHRMIKRLLVTWQHPEDALFADGAILVNQRGDRFCREEDSPAREIAIAGQPEKWAYLLLDGALAERYSRWPHFISTAPEIAYAYVDDYRRMRPDITVVADQLETLAQRRGLPLDALRATVAASKTDCRGPWVLLGPVKAYFTTTEGGAAIDTSMRVLDATGQVVPGLYAVGQNGLGGMVLWGHGLHIAWAITSGRLAGREIRRT